MTSNTTNSGMYNFDFLNSSEITLDSHPVGNPPGHIVDPSESTGERYDLHSNRTGQFSVDSPASFHGDPPPQQSHLSSDSSILSYHPNHQPYYPVNGPISKPDHISHIVSQSSSLPVTAPSNDFLIPLTQADLFDNRSSYHSSLPSTLPTTIPPTLPSTLDTITPSTGSSGSSDISNQMIPPTAMTPLTWQIQPPLEQLSQYHPIHSAYNDNPYCKFLLISQCQFTNLAIQMPLTTLNYQPDTQSFTRSDSSENFLPRHMPTGPAQSQPIDSNKRHHDDETNLHTTDDKRPRLSSVPHVELEAKSPTDSMKLRIQALFKSFPTNIPEIANKFTETILGINSDEWDQSDPDQVQIAFDLAYKLATPIFWEECSKNASFLARFRNWMAFMLKKKKYDAVYPGILALVNMGVRYKALEQHKLLPVLNVLQKKADSKFKLPVNKILTNAGPPPPPSPEPRISSASNKQAPTVKRSATVSTKKQSPQGIELDNENSNNIKATKITGFAKPKPTMKDKLPRQSGSELDKAPPVKKKLIVTTAAPGGSGFFQKMQSTPIPSTTIKKQPAAKKATLDKVPDDKSTASSSKNILVERVLKQEELKRAEKEAESKKLSSSILAAPLPHATLFSNHLSSIRNSAAKKAASATSNTGTSDLLADAGKSDKSRKKRKTVHWAEGDNLTHVKIFHLHPDEEEAMTLKRSFNAREQELHEADHLGHREKETEDEIEWYEPNPIDISSITGRFNDRSEAAASTRRGGRKEIISAEAKEQKKRESHALIAFYASDAEIPYSPSEPDPSTSAVVDKDPKKILISSRLLEIPEFQRLLNGHDFYNKDIRARDTALPDSLNPLIPVSQPFNSSVNNTTSNDAAFLISQLGNIISQAQTTQANTPWLPQPTATGTLPQYQEISQHSAPTPQINPDILNNVLGLLNQQGANNSNSSWQSLLMGGSNINSNTWQSAPNAMPPPPPAVVNTDKWDMPSGTDTSVVSEDVLQRRRKDVREFVRNDVTTTDKLRYPCRYWHTRCAKGDNCDFLHMQDH